MMGLLKRRKIVDRARGRNVSRRRRERGFTLLEIIVVVTIIALLATLVAPRLLKQVGSAKRKAALSEATTIAQQLQLYLLENGHDSVPPDLGLDALTQGNDPYLKPSDLIDPWDNPYVLIVPGECNVDFDVVSYGADGEPGGEGNNQDICHGQEDV